MDGAAIVQLIGSIGGAGVIAAVINGIINRRKLSADATEVINRAATDAVARVEGDNKRLREELAGKETRIVQLEHDKEVFRRALQRYFDYAQRVANAVQALGGDIEPPPPMSSDLLL